MDKRLPRILAALVALAAVGVVLALVLGGDDSDDDEATAHAFNVEVTTVALENAPTANVAGLVEGEPVGRMSIDIRRTVTVPPQPGGKPVPFTSDMTFSNIDGAIVAKLVGTAQIDSRGGSVEKGEAEISSGSGDYEGITGSFTITGKSPPGALSHLEGHGEVTY